MGAEYIDKDTKWNCGKCGTELQPAKVKVAYLGGSFEVELLKCPCCNTVLVTEELAAGKMLEVEKSLEDK